MEYQCALDVNDGIPVPAAGRQLDEPARIGGLALFKRRLENT